MLQITIPASEKIEMWDEVNCEFIDIPAQNEQVLQLEHSLIALSKWESKWCKPFFNDKDENRPNEEIIDYVRCMTINKNVDSKVYDRLTADNLKEIRDYIYAPMTATTIRENKSNTRNSQKITSELIYYWMISNNIPFECEKWHLNRLIMLIKVCAAHGEKPKKTSKQELASRYAEMNAINRRKFKSKG